MRNVKDRWLEQLGFPENYSFDYQSVLRKTYDMDTYYLELYDQRNGPNTTQRLMLAFPKRAAGPLPCVVVPFYFPEAMLGFDPETGDSLDKYRSVAIMLDLVKRGYSVASADAYHLTYIRSGKSISDFSRWADASRALMSDHPEWSGVGKLVADTRLVIDAVAADRRIDENRIGIMGHSLGGKMAFYTGCLDDRVKVIVASDFGIGWDQTNWRDLWYWGDKLQQIRSSGMDHSSLLGLFAPKPMMLIAGEYDDDTSFELMKRAHGYAGNEDKLRIINHATGHRPPMEVLEQGYDFIDEFLK